MVSAYNFKSEDEGKISSLANAFLPSHSIVPLEDDEKGFSEILIKQGDFVKEGQTIAKSKNIYVHSPVSGVVEEIADGLFSNGEKKLCAKIALKGELVFTGRKLKETDWTNYNDETLVYRLKEMGILNTFDKKDSLYKQIKNIKKRDGLVLFVRLFDEDPGVLVERFVSEHFTDKVFSGARILAKTLKANSIVFAVEKDSKINLQEKFQTVKDEARFFQVELDTKKYPCGTEHNIVSAVKKTFTDDDILKKTGKNDFFIDSVTALHIFEAIVLEKPEINSILQVNGNCLMSAAIINVKIGTTLDDLVKMCGGFKRNLSRIVINGFVMGSSVSNLKIPVTKSMKSVEFVSADKIKKQYSELCVRCGECKKVCPAELWPGNLYRIMHLSNRRNELLSSDSIAKTSLLCMECGLCNSVCPSRLPLMQAISLLKEKIDEKQ